MAIHKRKSNDYRLELSMKTFSPSRSTSTLTAAAPTVQQEDHTPLAIENNAQGGDARTGGYPASLEDKMEKLKVQTEKRKHIYETADTVIETLNQLSEVSFQKLLLVISLKLLYQVHEIARAASIVVSGIYGVSCVDFAVPFSY